MKKLTDRQTEILELISNYISQKGYAPSYQEIADKLNIKSKYAILKHIDALVTKGCLEKGSHARSLKIIHPEYIPSGQNECEIPLIGRIAAGFPIMAQENIERYIPIPRVLIKREGRYFALKVRGDSMSNAGIFEDDVILVNSTNQAKNKEIVVALLNDEVTVKRLIYDGSTPYLKAENPAYEDIYPEGDWSIQGKVIGLVREIQ
jgi:repressor LexA